MSLQQLHTQDNKCLNLGMATDAHLGDLGDKASNHLNYTGLDMTAKQCV
jgi:hypothetical protein